jgi:hypothetical protein
MNGDLGGNGTAPAYDYACNLGEGEAVRGSECNVALSY